MLGMTLPAMQRIIASEAPYGRLSQRSHPAWPHIAASYSNGRPPSPRRFSVRVQLTGTSAVELTGWTVVECWPPPTKAENAMVDGPVTQKLSGAPPLLT